jgi:hypothetical protein
MKIPPASATSTLRLCLAAIAVSPKRLSFLFGADEFTNPLSSIPLSQAYHVQTANVNVSYSALIVYNTEGQPPISIAGNKFADFVHIPVVMVTYECMQAMLGQYSAEKGYT